MPNHADETWQLGEQASFCSAQYEGIEPMILASALLLENNIQIWIGGKYGQYQNFPKCRETFGAETI